MKSPSVNLFSLAGAISFTYLAPCQVSGRIINISGKQLPRQSDSKTSEKQSPHLKAVSSSWNIATYYPRRSSLYYETFIPNKYPQRQTDRPRDKESTASPADSWIASQYQPAESQNSLAKEPSADSLDLSEKHQIPSKTPGVNGPDDRIRITNPSAFPYHCTGQIVATWSGIRTKDGFYKDFTVTGTGSLQGPHLLVTAAHVVYNDMTVGDEDDEIANFRFADKIAFYPGRNGNGDSVSQPASVYKICIPRTYYESRSHDADWAALSLDEDIGDSLGWNGKMSNWYIDKHTVYSYGYPGEKNGEMWLTVGQLKGKTDSIYKTTLDVTEGQSGSPVFADWKGHTYMVGILAFYATGWFHRTKYAGVTRINSFMYAFFQSYNTSLNWPTC